MSSSISHKRLLQSILKDRQSLKIGDFYIAKEENGGISVSDLKEHELLEDQHKLKKEKRNYKDLNMERKNKEKLKIIPKPISDEELNTWLEWGTIWKLNKNTGWGNIYLLIVFGKTEGVADRMCEKLHE